MDYFQYQKRERWYDYFEAANKCAKMIVEEKPDFVIHCGDLFHQFKPSPGALRLAIQILDKFKQAKIPFYVIRGNHDASKAQAQRFGGTILKFLEDLGYLYYIQDESVQINNQVTFTGVGEYGKTTGTVIEEVIRNNPLKKEKYNILALHGYVQGQVSDSIFDVSGYQLASMGFHYIALGHYHKHWEERGNNIYCPGSTEHTSINDWDKPDKDGYIRKNGYFSVKINFNSDSKKWVSKIERKLFDIRPKGRFIFNFSEDDSLDEIISKANDFVKKNDLEGAIIRYDFVGRLPLGKQSLVNFSNLTALKESKALHVIANPQITNIEIKQAKPGISIDEALIELLKDSYKTKKDHLNNWLDITNETIRVLGLKSISSEESEEINLIYDTISEFSKKITDSEIEIAKNPKTIAKKKNNESAKETIQNKRQEAYLKNENKTTKQSDLSIFFSEEGNK